VIPPTDQLRGGLKRDRVSNFCKQQAHPKKWIGFPKKKDGPSKKKEKAKKEKRIDEKKKRKERMYKKRCPTQ